MKLRIRGFVAAEDGAPGGGGWRVRHGVAAAGIFLSRSGVVKCVPKYSPTSLCVTRAELASLRVFRGLPEALGTSGAELLRKAENAG